jgi:dynein intermediate chain
MADRRAELEKKRLKLQQLRDEKERRKREKESIHELEENSGNKTKDIQEVDDILKSVGIIAPLIGH